MQNRAGELVDIRGIEAEKTAAVAMEMAEGRIFPGLDHARQTRRHDIVNFRRHGEIGCIQIMHHQMDIRIRLAGEDRFARYQIGKVNIRQTQARRQGDKRLEFPAPAPHQDRDLGRALLEIGGQRYRRSVRIFQ